MDHPIATDLGAFLKDIRKMGGSTVPEVAETIGRPKHYVVNLEKGWILPTKDDLYGLIKLCLPTMSVENCMVLHSLVLSSYAMFGDDAPKEGMSLIIHAGVVIQNLYEDFLREDGISAPWHKGYVDIDEYEFGDEVN